MSVINGTDLYCFIEGVAIAHATSHTLSIKTLVIPTSNKDTGLFATKIPGRSDVTVTCEGFLAYGDFESVVNAKIARLPVTLSLGKKLAGALDTSYAYFTGEFIITSYEMTGADNSVATYSVTFDHYEDFAMYNVYGPELVDQAAWYTAAYWDMNFSACFTQSGTHIVANGTGNMMKTIFFTPGKDYFISWTVTVSSGGAYQPFNNSTAPPTGWIVVNTTESYSYSPLVSLVLRIEGSSWVGTLTALSIKEIL
jgi:hypothetical protein